MALPKVATPTYELTIPSTGKKIKYRPFLVKEEKMLMMALEGENSNVTKAIKDVLIACSQSKIDINSLAPFDIEYFFLQLRGKSVGDKIQIKLKKPESIDCEEKNCGQLCEVNLDVSEITVDSSTVNDGKINITENENAQSLSEKLSTLASHNISDIIDSILDKKINFKPQDHSKTTYAKKIIKSEGLIDWNDTAENIIGKINGLYPYPGGYFLFKGERYKILKAEKYFSKESPGKVLTNDLEISCGTNSIKILEIQREGKKSQKINEFLPGSQIQKGTKLSDV